MKCRIFLYTNKKIEKTMETDKQTKKKYIELRQIELISLRLSILLSVSFPRK